MVSQTLKACFFLSGQGRCFRHLKKLYRCVLTFCRSQPKENAAYPGQCAMRPTCTRNGWGFFWDCEGSGPKIYICETTKQVRAPVINVHIVLACLQHSTSMTGYDFELEQDLLPIKNTWQGVLGGPKHTSSKSGRWQDSFPVIDNLPCI